MSAWMPLLETTGRALIRETEVTWIAQGTHLEGKFLFQNTVRVEGTLHGEVVCQTPCEFILGEAGTLEGSFEGDTLWIEGLFKGHILAHRKVVVTATGRVFGEIQTPSLELAFGAFFEGRCVSLSPEKANKNE